MFSMCSKICNQNVNKAHTPLILIWISYSSYHYWSSLWSNFGLVIPSGQLTHSLIKYISRVLSTAQVNKKEVNAIRKLKKYTKIKNISTAYILAFLPQNDPKFGRKKFLNPKFLGISKKSFFKKVDFGLKWKLMDYSFMKNFYFCPMTSSRDVIAPQSAEYAFLRVSSKNEFF